jgi:hypothetical protein
MLKRIKRITSHVGVARFYAEALMTGVIPRQADIPSPYSYSPTWNVFEWKGKNVIVRETAHKQYDVFEVPAEMIQPELPEATA